MKYLVTMSLENDLRAYLRLGEINIVTFVKMIRATTGCSLRFAKTLAEVFRDTERAEIDVLMSGDKLAEFSSKFLLQRQKDFRVVNIIVYTAPDLEMI